MTFKSAFLLNVLNILWGKTEALSFVEPSLSKVIFYCLDITHYKESIIVRTQTNDLMHNQFVKPQI